VCGRLRAPCRGGFGGLKQGLAGGNELVASGLNLCELIFEHLEQGALLAHAKGVGAMIGAEVFAPDALNEVLAAFEQPVEFAAFARRWGSRGRA